MFRLIVFFSCLMLLSACGQRMSANQWQWEVLKTQGQPTPRHEASFVEHKGRLYLIGGRRINPVDVFDPQTNTWEARSTSPIELHHFQAVSLGDAIYILGAMTGGWPNERPLEKVMAYYPETDTFEYLHDIPKSRRRGGAGVVSHSGKLYIVGGITNGHIDGYQPWLDEYDPKTGAWRVLPSAQFARDHVQAVTLKDKLYVFGGRTSRHRTGEVMSLLVEHGEVFDFKTEQWLPVTDNLALPNLRAGNSIVAWGDDIIVGGGESPKHEASHTENDVYNTVTKAWSRWPDSLQGRHGTGYVQYNGYLYTASGSLNRGGGPELTSIERLKLPTLKLPTQTRANPAAVSSDLPVHQQYNTVTLEFEGPDTSEQAQVNPFTDYLLEVEFTHKNSNITVRGYYAADGNAANTGASQGNIWAAKFSPQKLGFWTYKATMHQGENIAVNGLDSSVKGIGISNAQGQFRVVPSDKDGVDFRANGFLDVKGGYFYHPNTNKFWLKTGANSPENLLGYYEIDGTYRTEVQAREGEATAAESLHKFAAHSGDWNTGDPTWGEHADRGKNMIGALNYLANKGMNANYFLTMNINGDGKDVWPFVSHDDFTRFDVSKLAQWDVIFSHMQAKGILLHMVIQETENERLFDDGDMGPQRQLYLNELIARFAHHPALVWNLGEENGPAPWSPVAQNDAQRKAMASYLKQADPYQHPVLLHTHSSAESKDEIVAPQLGHKPLDGLSFQVHPRESANSEVIKWRQKAAQSGHEWLITMDEIGEWHTAALPDSLDPNHDSLRRYALWGTLMAGAAGVEWYFGAKYPHNDLTSEDWRERDRLWDLSRYAQRFFVQHLPFWQMRPSNELLNVSGHYVFAKAGEVYAVYLHEHQSVTLDLSAVQGRFSVSWFDPNTGGALKEGSITELAGGANRALGSPPPKAAGVPGKDWVVLIKKR